MSQHPLEPHTANVSPIDSRRPPAAGGSPRRRRSDALRVARDASLSIYAQIAVEFHDLGSAGDANRLSKYEVTIERLTRQFQSVHVHGNNHSPFVSVFNIAFPDVLEVTFANRQRYRFIDGVETFPTSLDMPNKKDALDLWLGTFAY